MKRVFTIEDLDCAVCASKLQEAIAKVKGVHMVQVDFIAQQLTLDYNDQEEDRVFRDILAVCAKVEPDCRIVGMHAERHHINLDLWQLIVAGALLVVSLVLRYSLTSDAGKIACLVVSIGALLAAGWDVFLSAVKKIAHGQLLDECFLMSIAAIGAFVIGEYPEGVSVMLFYKIGEMFEDHAVEKSRKSIQSMLRINPDMAVVLRDDVECDVPCSDVQIGEIVVVKVGDIVPLDGVVEEGSAYLDMSSLQGESEPRAVGVGEDVWSGAVVVDGSLRIRTVKVYAESTASKMIELVNQARAQKAPSERFISQFAKVYTPVVVGAAVLLAVIGPLCVNMHSWTVWMQWIKRAMVFLVVSCPCALVISVPLTYFGAIGLASRLGILVKGGYAFAALTKCKVVAFDKTGTLTKGSFEVTEVCAQSVPSLLQCAYSCEQHSNHPIAQCICRYCVAQGAEPIKQVVHEIRGLGMMSEGECTILVGNERLMFEQNVTGVPAVLGVGSIVYVAKDGVCLGYIRVQDVLKSTSQDVVCSLRDSGLRTVMLSGDNEQTVRAVAQEAGVDEYYAAMMPQDKVAAVNQMRLQGNVVFVGDGINDAPVLAGADVGVAMGGIGADAAIESADVVLMDDDLRHVVDLKQVAAKTQRIVAENIAFAIGVKLGAMVLSLTSFAQTAAMMWVAVLADVGVSILAVLNSMRAARSSKQ